MGKRLEKSMLGAGLEPARDCSQGILSRFIYIEGTKLQNIRATL